MSSPWRRCWAQCTLPTQYWAPGLGCARLAGGGDSARCSQGAPSPRGTKSSAAAEGGLGAKASVPPRRSRTLLRTYHSPSTHRSIQRPLSMLCPRRYPRCVVAPIAHGRRSSARRDRPSPPLALTRPMVAPVWPSPPRPRPAFSPAPANVAASSGPSRPGHTGKSRL